MKYLYHGTTGDRLASIQANGIRPRGRDKSRWQMASGRDRVYLTDAYAPYFALNEFSPSAPPIVFEIDADKLDAGLFMADEDFVEQATRGGDPQGSMQERTRYFRNNMRRLTDANPHLTAALSLEKLGTCAYEGVIPPEAITQVMVIDKPGPFALTFDPMIMLANYRICGPEYRFLTAKLFNREPREEDAEDMRLQAERWAKLGVEKSNGAAALAPYRRLSTLEKAVINTPLESVP